MATAQLISVDEYLHTSFEHDAEYVEGRIVYRPLPTNSHSGMQGFLVYCLTTMRNELGVWPWPEQRIQTRSDPPHFRVPDVCVTNGRPDEEILTTPPFLCIEILSPGDSALELRAKIDEYLEFGVSYVWVIDPIARTGEVYTLGAIEKIRDGKFRAGAIEIDLAEMP